MICGHDRTNRRIITPLKSIGYNTRGIQAVLEDGQTVTGKSTFTCLFRKQNITRSKRPTLKSISQPFSKLQGGPKKKKAAVKS